MAVYHSETLLLGLFNSETVVDFSAIKNILGGVSISTVFRHLNKVSYRRSFNYNGKFYTLHDHSLYDQHGLWSWKGIHFSMDGSLKRTVIRFVKESASGFSHRELKGFLHIRAHNTLLHLVKTKEISREEIDGYFVYLHPDQNIRTSQLSKRKDEIEIKKFKTHEVTDAMVIQVLLILIHYSGSQPGEIARRLKGCSPPITIRHIHSILNQYSLEHFGQKKGSKNA